MNICFHYYMFLTNAGLLCSINIISINQMKNSAQANAAISISSEMLESYNKQNTQFAYIKYAKQPKNKTQYDQEGSQSNKTKQEKLIQLLICLKLLEMGIDWRQNFQILQLKLQANKNSTIEDVPRIVNQIVSSLQQRENREIHQDEEGLIVQSFFQSFNKQPRKKQKTQTKIQGKQLIECPICFIDTYQYFQLPCQHIFCKQCITQTIKQDLKNGRFDGICPDYSCGKRIPNEILEQALQKSAFDRLLYFRVKQALQINPQNKFCSTPDCGELLMSTSSFNLQCKKCRKLYCKNCLQEAHEKNCDEQLLERMKKLYFSHKIKKCPKCKAPIQKIEGCNHMTCSKCQYSFCWICLSQYTDHHYRFYNLFGCPRMQFQDEDQINIQRVKQVCFFFFLPLLILLLVLCLLLFLPLFIILNFLFRPCSWIGQHQQICQSKLILHTICCCRCSNKIRDFLAYFILLPRSFLYAVFVAPLNFIYLLFNEFMGFMY